MTHKIKQHTVHSDQTKGESTLLPRPIILFSSEKGLCYLDFHKHRVSKFMARNVINQNSSTVCHFSANGTSLCLGEAEIKIYERSLQALLFLHPLRLHHLLRCSLVARFTCHYWRACSQANENQTLCSRD